MEGSDEEIEVLVRLDLRHLRGASNGPKDLTFREIYAHVRRRQLHLEFDGPKSAAFNVALDLMQAEFPGFEPGFDVEYFALS